MRQVVVTGLGTINPLGHNARDTWEACTNGVSGVGPITLFDSADFLVQIACEVKDFEPAEYMSKSEARRRDRFEQLATVAANEAMEQSGLQVTEENARRIGAVVSSAIGGILTLENAVLKRLDSGPRRVSPFVIPMLMPNGASAMVGIDHGLQGPALSISSACASGADGIGLAWRLIRSGEIDAAIAGGAEATVGPVAVASFDRLGAMSRRNDDYSTTPQPFDKNRDGLVMGEGAAILILEEYEHAKKRGAEIIAELAGYSATADAFHITAPHETGIGGATAIRNALDVAGVCPADVSYINAHGTATVLNDVSETRAVKAAFGEHAYDIPVSSTKSMTGHMMGATGALEAIFCVQAIHRDAIPPTINYETPDPECDLDCVPNTARETKVDVAVSNAFGFGGHNAVLVFKKIE